MGVDEKLFIWINDLGGHIVFLDRVISSVANDYFVIIAFCLVLIGMWFGSRSAEKRSINQVAVLKSMASLGIASGFVSWANYLLVTKQMLSGTLLSHIFNRPRPFIVFGNSVVHNFYQPTDPSFPSNFVAVVFGMALAVYVANHRVGKWLLAAAVLSSIARIYVGVHWPTDVLGGLVFAIIGVGLTYFLFWVFKPLVRLLKWILGSLYISG
jgi:undecaprenyl-diphosphatase